MTMPHNIYIHVPYCLSKCRYCAFFSTACAAPDWDAYQKKIISEIEYWGSYLGKLSVPTIFFGGGTPSLMNVATFDAIMTAIAKSFHIEPGAEVTLESNPGTLDATKINDFKTAGVNRLSVGVQSLNDDELRFLGRRHSALDARKILDAAANVGLHVSADFIYGLPGQNAQDTARMCEEINNLGLSHCSMYELTIESGTPLAASNPEMPNNATMAKMYGTIQEKLRLPRYEVSNYAAPGFECAHNMNVWDGAPYIGIGRAAAGRIFFENKWYEQMGDGAMFAPISTHDRAVEKIITGMRTVRGVSLSEDVRDAINWDWVRANGGLVTECNGRICTTNAGNLILDDILTNMVV